MIIHKQVEIELNEEKIKIDEKLANIILKLNRCGCNTIYSCQGDKYNEGYVKFDENTDMELAYNILNALLPYHVLRLDFHNIIRFARTKQAYINRYNAVKMFKNKTRKSNKESILK